MWMYGNRVRRLQRLTEWKALGTVTNSIGRSDLSDASGMDFDRRFYRAFIAP